MNSFAITQQGFQGALSLPRELFVKETRHVVHNATEKSPGNSKYIKNTDGSWTASTLGVRPAHDVVEGLRKGSQLTRYQCDKMKCDARHILLPTNLSHSYEFTVNIKKTTGITGVTIAASPDREEYTNVYFDPSNNTIVFDRTHSSLIDMFLNTSYIGCFEPYQMEAKRGGKPVTEPIKMDIFVDGSLVEVFVNDRFALTSRIYPSREDSNGIALFSASDVDVEYLDIEVWDGLLNVWPNRPLNSSSLLVFDTPAETGNYTWWSGN